MNTQKTKQRKEAKAKMYIQGGGVNINLEDLAKRWTEMLLEQVMNGKVKSRVPFSSK